MAIAIIGGGIAGLAVAFELTRRGLPFQLIEMQRRAGGVVLTDRVDPFTIDAGADALLKDKPAGIDLCRDLGLADRLMDQSEPRTVYVLLHRRMVPLPDRSLLGIPIDASAVLRFTLLPWPSRLRVLAEPLIAREGGGQDESIADFMRRRFGQTMVTRLAAPLLGGIHAGRVERLSVHALFPRLVELEQQHGSVLRGLRRTHQPPNGGRFVTLVGGLQTLIDRLVEGLPRDALRLGDEACRIVTDGAGYSIELRSGTRIRASAIVLATPAFVTRDLLRSVAPEVAELCGQIPYASTVAVALAFPRQGLRHPLNGAGFVVPRTEGLRITAVTWLSTKWPDRAPAGSVLLRAFYGGTADPSVLDLTDDQLIQMSVSELGPLLDIQAPPILARVYRWPGATPQYEVGHQERVREIERRLSKHPGLFLTGSGFRGVGIPDCIADGRATAAAAAAEPSQQRPRRQRNHTEERRNGGIC